MTEDLRYEINGVGGIAHAELVLRPGVNALRGRNGSGKTSAVRAVARAAGGDVSLERRDGCEVGSVEGGGVRLRVGEVVTRTGEAALELADATPLSNLIDPQMKNSDAAARARIRALVQLLGLVVDDASLEVLCSGDTDLLEWLQGQVKAHAIDGLMDAAESLRQHAHALARVHETDAFKARGRADAALERCGELIKTLGGEGQLLDLPVEDVRAALVSGSREYERLVAQARARSTLEAQQAEIRATLGDRPDTAVALERLQRQQEVVETAREAVERRQRELDDAKAHLAEMRRDEERARAESADVSLRAAKWDKAQEVLAREPEGPTRDELP
jgi:DNA repair ATPase RecN